MISKTNDDHNTLARATSKIFDYSAQKIDGAGAKGELEQMTYKYPECQQESELYDLQHLAAVSIRNDLEPDVIMVQIDIECPKCGEIVLTHVMALDDFSPIA